MANQTEAEGHERGSGPSSPEKGAGEADREVAGEKPLGSRAPQYVKRSRTLHLGWQAGVFAIGLAVVVAGVIMLPLPGPGWLVIFAGMAIWATEFVWAQLVLRWTKRKVAEATRRALDPRVRRRNITLTAVAAAICAALLSVYLWKYGFAMPWEINR
ncbi:MULTISPECIES: TIGR02611 family protein [unclassified Streptomyces]|uniref:TIGR02611 family protein n=1 Tax=unclassified Streptomyces TaxID=2593676 RepID=UPI002DDA8526|nr:MULTISPECIES: TIGR02611 family protein [unclassified Streptomyces]WSA94931.1 TIGR02611 family protein [Streptomyces sp. NBC_01795]WSB79351.1 TIGR02611 family protein [Streptomyces sp. NBC_01775]WSS12443.1 TIGR02611 family protein [Streptomyces sp. NBC_01186]WSS41230.1 TIGR02611 family protein [Streptomyces sp. NBC_01187]